MLFQQDDSIQTDSALEIMMDSVDPAHLDYLDYSIERNRQLHMCVQQKQEEISALKVKNAELMELVKQAETYAAVLGVFTSGPEDPSPCLGDFAPHSDASAESCDWPFETDLQPSWLESLLDHTAPDEGEACSHTILTQHGEKTPDVHLHPVQRSHTILTEHANTGLKRRLWPSSSESPGKKSRAEHEHEQTQRHSHTHPAGVQVYGSFHAFQVSNPTPSANSDPTEDKQAFLRRPSESTVPSGPGFSLTAKPLHHTRLTEAPGSSGFPNRSKHSSSKL